jgi:hypothetical protein
VDSPAILEAHPLIVTIDAVAPVVATVLRKSLLFGLFSESTTGLFFEVTVKLTFELVYKLIPYIV